MPNSIAFPIRLNNKTGSVVLSSGNQRTQEQILEILTTKYLERVLRPSFGTDEYLFTAVSDPGVISTKIKSALDNYLSPNIQTTVSSKLFNSGRVELTVDYLDTSTNISGNLNTEFDLNFI